MSPGAHPGESEGEEEHYAVERIQKRKQEACPEQWLPWGTVGYEFKKLGRAEP